MRQTLNLSLPSAVTAAACRSASRRGDTLANGDAAIALELDNRSGFWLQVYPSGSFVAPYTVGAVIDFGTPAPSIDVLYVPTGPAGQLSSLGGSDTVTITLYDRDEAPPASEGAPFTTGFTPIRTAVATVAGSGTLIAGVAGKRIRIRSLSWAMPGTSLSSYDSPMYVAIADNPLTGTFDVGWIGGQAAGRASDFHAFPEGLDFPVGSGVDVTTLGNYQAPAINVVATYQLI